MKRDIKNIRIQDYMFLKNLEGLQEYEKIRQLVKYFDIENEKYKNIDTLFSDILDLYKEKDQAFQNKFMLDGKEFGFIPKLEDITVGEYLDIDAYQSDENSIHKLLAILYRPITKKSKDSYEIEEYNGSNKYSEVMLNAPVSIYLGSIIFFCNLSKGLSLI